MFFELVYYTVSSLVVGSAAISHAYQKNRIKELEKKLNADFTEEKTVITELVRSLEGDDGWENKINDKQLNYMVNIYSNIHFSVEATILCNGVKKYDFGCIYHPFFRAFSFYDNSLIKGAIDIWNLKQITNARIKGFDKITDDIQNAV